MSIEISVFSQRLQDVRNEFGMKRNEFAQYLGMHPSTIGRYEKMEIQATLTAIHEISKKLNINPGWFLGWTEEKYLDKNTVEKRIPIVGTIAAGIPITATEQLEGWECVCENDPVDFCLRVKGDSMIDARIHDGDLVYIRQQDDVETGEIAAVIIDGQDATLKRVYKADGVLILRAANIRYPDRVFTKKDRKDLKIIGKAVFLKGEVR